MRLAATSSESPVPVKTSRRPGKKTEKEIQVIHIWGRKLTKGSRLPRPHECARRNRWFCGSFRRCSHQLRSQLSRRVAGVDEQQVAWLDIDRQRVPLNERKRRRSLPGFQQFCHGILMQVVRIICLGCPASRATVDTPCRIPNSTTDAA